MKKLSTYIFIHDQQLILACEKEGRFNKLPDVNYVLLGEGENDLIENRIDVIIARDLTYNIEPYRKFCSFTGWYALWKNNIIKSEYVNLFEYDIEIKDYFLNVTSELIEQRTEFIGYVPLSMEFVFTTQPAYLGGIISLIYKRYQIRVDEIVRVLLFKNPKAEWSSTSNSTFMVKTFNQYMDWFEVLIDDLKASPMCGHAHERSITFFYLIYKNKIALTRNLIKHLMLNSHKSS